MKRVILEPNTITLDSACMAQVQCYGLKYCGDKYVLRCGESGWYFRGVADNAMIMLNKTCRALLTQALKTNGAKLFKFENNLEQAEWVVNAD